MRENHYLDVSVGFACSEEDDNYARGSVIMDRSHRRSQMKSIPLINNMVNYNFQKPIPNWSSPGSTRSMLNVGVPG